MPSVDEIVITEPVQLRDAEGSPDQCFEFSIARGRSKDGKRLLFSEPQLIQAESPADVLRIINEAGHEFTAAELDIKPVERMGRPVWSPPKTNPKEAAT